VPGSETWNGAPPSIYEQRDKVLAEKQYLIAHIPPQDIRCLEVNITPFVKSVSNSFLIKPLHTKVLLVFINRRNRLNFLFFFRRMILLLVWIQSELQVVSGNPKRARKLSLNPQVLVRMHKVTIESTLSTFSYTQILMK